jgi:hypothetical protein
LDFDFPQVAGDFAYGVGISQRRKQRRDRSRDLLIQDGFDIDISQEGIQIPVFQTGPYLI